MNSRLVRLRDFDPLLALAALGLVTLGLMLIYSGSLSQFGRPSLHDLGHPVVRQAMFAVAGVFLALMLARLDYRALGTYHLVLYIASVALLAFVVVHGEATHGSRRWITLAGTQVQPSEIAKLVVVITLAKYFSERQDRMQGLRVIVTSLVIAAVPAGLVFAQPDLGSAVIFAAIWLGMVIVAGANWRHLLSILGMAAAALPFIFIGFVSEYQRERIRLWLDPARDPLGAGFQSLQARISIGSGGIAGKGLTHGTQTQLEYLRTRTTDYIFSVLGEELGLVGALILFALFSILLWRALRVAELARDSFGRLLATGIVIYILLQAFINIGVNVGLLPVTGIPLPFVSQGGSSLITLLASLGLLQSILLRHQEFTFRTFYS